MLLQRLAGPGRAGGGGGCPSLGLPPPCDITSGCCFFTGPWTVTRPSLRMLRRVATFCRPLRPVLLLVSFPRSRSPVVWCAGAVLDVAGCAVCASAAPNNWRIGGCAGCCQGRPPPPCVTLRSSLVPLRGPENSSSLGRRSPLRRVRRVIGACSAVGAVRVAWCVCAWGPVKWRNDGMRPGLADCADSLHTRTIVPFASGGSWLMLYGYPPPPKVVPR